MSHDTTARTLRAITTFTLSPTTLQLIDAVVLKARDHDAIAVRLGLRVPGHTAVYNEAALDIDAEGLSPENYAALNQMLGGGPITKATVIERINGSLAGGDEAKALEALQYMTAAQRANRRAMKCAVTRRAQFLTKESAGRRSAINNSRVVEALILMGVEYLENGSNCERSSKSGISQNSDVRKIARKPVNSASRQTDVSRTGDRTAGTAA